MSSPTQQKITGVPLEEAEALRLGLSIEMWQDTLQQLGRQPTELEVRILVRMWSEDCSNRTSRRFIQTLFRGNDRPTSGPIRCGAISIDEQNELIVRVEHMNDLVVPEPSVASSAAVGGVLESIRAAGAEPLGIAASYRVGGAESTENCILIRRELDGAAWFANHAGIPLLQQDVFFHPRYDGSPLLNAFAFGIRSRTQVAVKPEIGSPVLIVGLPTGSDGLREEQATSPRPGAPLVTVQRLRYCEPFNGELLASALMAGRAKQALIDAVELGRGGMAFGAFELSRRWNVGLRIDAGRAPVRAGISQSRQVFLSESATRALVIVSKGKHREFSDLCVTWGLEPVVIGEVIDSEGVEFAWQHHLVGSIPTKLPLGIAQERHFELLKYPPMLRKRAAPESDGGKRIKLARDKKRTEWDDIRDATGGAEVTQKGMPEAPSSLEDVWVDLLADPNVCSRRLIHVENDSALGGRTVTRSGNIDWNEGAVIQLDNGRALALTLVSAPLFMDDDPYLGSVHAVARGLQNLAAAGAEPVGLAAGMNFGSPDRHREISAFSEAVRGLGDACRVWNIPIVADSVSLSNGSESNPILPSPNLLLIGQLEQPETVCGVGFKRAGDKVFIVGELKDEIGCSEYLFSCYHRMEGGVPDIDFDRQLLVCATIRELVRAEKLNSVRTLKAGGLAVALAESCLLREKPIGAEIVLPFPETQRDLRSDVFLFSETIGRFLISCKPEHESEVREIFHQKGLMLAGEGSVGGKSIRVEGAIKAEIPLTTARRIWEGGLNHILAATAAAA